MTTSLSVKLSTDSGNQLALGTDQGLYAPSVTAASNTYAWTIDNSWVGSGTQSFYTSATTAPANYAVPSGTAQIWPFLVTRSCRVTDAALYASTAAASSFMNVSVYAAASGTRQPGAKITDLLRFPGTATGAIRGTVSDSTTVLVAHTLYWMVNWANNGTPTVGSRALTQQGYVRLSATPTAVPPFGTVGFAMTETTNAWGTATTGPATLTPVGLPLNAGHPANNVYVPLISWGLTNA